MTVVLRGRIARRFGLSACLAFVPLALVGCNAGRAFVASPSDYADYRRVRLGATIDERLAAAWVYLKERPEGRYAPRLRAYFNSAEPLYFKVRKQSAAGLEAYVSALPDGPHAGASLEELMRVRNESRREALSERATTATLLRIENEEHSRKAAAELLEWWVAKMLTPALWHGPFSAAPPEVLARFRLASPEPACQSNEAGQRCTKGIERMFRVRGPGGEVDQTLRVELALRLDSNYRLMEFRLSGVRLALLAEEAAAGLLSNSDPEGAEAAWRALLARLSLGVLKAGLACTGGENATGGLKLDCDEPAVTLTASSDPSGNETLLIERRSDPPSRPPGEAPLER